MSTTPARGRYPSDLPDLRWADVEHPFPQGDGHAGRPRSYPLREVVNAVLYLAGGGRSRRMLAHDFPPRKTVSYFYPWRGAGVWGQVHAALRAEVRGAAGKEPTPSLAVIDSQAVKTTEAGGPKGYDGGEKVAGRKRHVLVATLGLVWGPAVPAAAPTDWGGAAEVIKRVGEGLPRPAEVLADCAYRAEALAEWIKGHCRWHLETSGERPGRAESEPVRWRWIVERTLGWFGRCRRLSKGYEHNPRSSEAWVYIAMIHRMSRFSMPEGNKDDDLLRRPPKRLKT